MALKPTPSCSLRDTKQPHKVFASLNLCIVFSPWVPGPPARSDCTQAHADTSICYDGTLSPWRTSVNEPSRQKLACPRLRIHRRVNTSSVARQPIYLVCQKVYEYQVRACWALALLLLLSRVGKILSLLCDSVATATLSTSVVFSRCVRHQEQL